MVASLANSPAKSRPVHTDITLKDLLWQGAPGLLRQLTGATAAQILATEYPDVRARRPDFVARLTDGRLFHLELQSTRDPDMALRMLEYYGLICGRHGHEPVTQMVLALSDAVARAMPRGFSHAGLILRYDVVGFESLDATPLLESGRADDAILAILCRSAHVRDRIRAILVRLAALEPPRRRDALARLMVLAGVRGLGLSVQEEAKTMPLRLEIQGNDFLEHIYAQGEARGEARGQMRGLAHALVRQMQRRFGPLPAAMEARIHAASTDQLTQWLDRVLDAPTLDDVFKDANREA